MAFSLNYLGNSHSSHTLNCRFKCGTSIFTTFKSQVLSFFPKLTLFGSNIGLPIFMRRQIRIASFWPYSMSYVLIQNWNHSMFWTNYPATHSDGRGKTWFSSVRLMSLFSEMDYDIHLMQCSMKYHFLDKTLKSRKLWMFAFILLLPYMKIASRLISLNCRWCRLFEF